MDRRAVYRAVHFYRDDFPWKRFLYKFQKIVFVCSDKNSICLQRSLFDLKLNGFFHFGIGDWKRFNLLIGPSKMDANDKISLKMLLCERFHLICDRLSDFKIFLDQPMYFFSAHRIFYMHSQLSVLAIGVFEKALFFDGVAQM